MRRMRLLPLQQRPRPEQQPRLMMRMRMTLRRRTLTRTTRCLMPSLLLLLPMRMMRRR